MLQETCCNVFCGGWDLPHSMSAFKFLMMKVKLWLVASAVSSVGAAYPGVSFSWVLWACSGLSESMGSRSRGQETELGSLWSRQEAKVFRGKISSQLEVAAKLERWPQYPCWCSFCHTLVAILSEWPGKEELKMTLISEAQGTADVSSAVKR